MRADVSRSTFAQYKHYRDVRWQMGRVPVDADLNEYVDIAAHRVETETIDVVGESGAPVHAAGFQLAATPAELPPAQQAPAAALGALAPGDFLLSAGRYYVGGVMCENDAPIKFSMQAAGDLPDAQPLAASGTWLVYLDVWARHLSFHDDPQIREVALGGPDTATRQRNVWQVRAVRVGNAGAAADCDALYEPYNAATAPPTGTLAADVDTTTPPTTPCVLPPGGGYRRQENQLYRVEIHDPGNAGAAATFKWSRDNGAVISRWQPTSAADTIRLTDPPRDEMLGFSVGQLVELTDDRNELLATPGFLATIRQVVGDRLTLDANVPAGFARNPKVRRWDGALAPVTTGALLPLEDGVQVGFSAGSYRTGDYWMIPARTATGRVEWPRTTAGASFVPPHGVRHRYARIGFIDFDGTTVVPRDCRRLFQPLTEIEEEADLRLHNRHLHGKGVVCGLRVECVGTDRTTVRVRPGHAIDCAGVDILVEQPVRVGLVERSRALGLLDAEGDGDVHLTMRAQVDGPPVFDVRTAPPEPSGAAAIARRILEGTIWQDFFDDCLQPIINLLRRELFDTDPGDTTPVPRQKRALLTALNLLAHRNGTPPDRRLWLSAEQHAILERLFDRLMSVAARSSSYCAIADDPPRFPAYPFERQNIRTAFIAQKVSGVRMLPDSALAVAWSDDAPGRLHVLDLDSGEMVRDAKLSVADGLTVRDATAATMKGKPVVVVTSGDSNKTVLTVLDAEGTRELDAFVFPGNELTRLEAHSRRPDIVLAVEPGRGVHFLDLRRLSSAPLGEPLWKFLAAGHIAVANDRVCMTARRAASATGGGTTGYEALHFGRLRAEGEDPLEAEILLARIDPSMRSGEDGVALVSSQHRLFAHVVVDAPAGTNRKRVLVLDAERLQRVSVLDLPPADDGSVTGDVRMGVIRRAGRVAYALAKRNLLLTTGAEGKVFEPRPLPAQAEPIAVCDVPLEGTPQLVVAANRASMTLTLIPPKLLGDVDVDEAQIAKYRDELLAAFERLTLLIAQGLKDCLCEHLLIDCPECEPNEVLQLAKVEVRGGRVLRVCSTDRQEVLTFPKVKYWLSAVPVIPLVGYLVDKFCCWVFAAPKEAAGTATAGAASTSSAGASKLGLTPATALAVLDAVRGGKVKSAVVDNVTRARMLSTLMGRVAAEKVVQPETTPAPVVRIGDVVDRDRGTAAARLAERDVVVSGVEDFDDAIRRGAGDLTAAKLPTSIQPGETVKLYTRGETVVFYQVVRAGAAEGGTSGTVTPDVRAELTGMRTELREELDRLRAAQAQELATRDRDLAALKLADVTIDAELRRIATAPSTGGADLRGSVDALRQELTALRESHAVELAARDRQLVELRTQNEKLITEMDVTTRRLTSDIQRIGRTRPP